MSRARRAILLGVLSLALGGAAAADLKAREDRLESRIGPLAAVLVTAKPVEKGGWLTRGTLAVRIMPRRWIPAGALARLPGAGRIVALARLPAGAMLGPGSWGSGEIPAASVARGERAVMVTALAPVGSLVGGGAVDLLSSQGGGAPRRIVAGARLVAWRRLAPGDVAEASKVEADLACPLSCAMEVAGAGASGAELRLLPVGEG